MQLRHARWATAAVFVLGVLGSAGGCTYARLATPLAPVHGRARTSVGAPEDAVSVTIVSVRTGRRRGAIPWDDGGGPPDVFVRVYRNDVLAFESRTIEDDDAPTFDVTLPENLRLGPGSHLRIEVWDRDTIGADPVGTWHGSRLPRGETHLRLGGSASIVVRADNPRPFHGIGLAAFEAHDDALYVLEVEPYSPAGRAGLAAGDAIVAIGARTVPEMGSTVAVNALEQASEDGASLRVRDALGEERVVELDRGYTYLVE